MTVDHPIASKEEWLAARCQLLADEKAFTQQREQLAARRRALPWLPVDQPYAFTSVDTGQAGLTLANLFDGHSQLLLYHFMFGPTWTEGCPSCSFWADSYDGVGVHLAQRDVSLVAVSRGPVDELRAYRQRMGWSFPWYSSAGSDFNVDFGASFTADQQEQGASYNYTPMEHPPEELPGLSAFALDGGTVYHTYSCYARGLDPFNTAYQLLDLAPRGRQEDDLPWPMAWVRRHDSYQ